MAEPRCIHDVAAVKARLEAITRSVRIDLKYLHAGGDATRGHVARATREARLILDVGGGTRGALADRQTRVETLDINPLADGPDILGDLCQPLPDWMHGRYDAAAALAILEHVYDPAAALANLRAALAPGGRLFLYVPWIYRYHAPPDLMFQDYQRLSRDGLAYALRGFEDVTLYPLRGKYTTMANLLKVWKTRVERHLGQRRTGWLDARVSTWRNTVQASGYFVEARRP